MELAPVADEGRRAVDDRRTAGRRQAHGGWMGADGGYTPGGGGCKDSVNVSLAANRCAAEWYMWHAWDQSKSATTNTGVPSTT